MTGSDLRTASDLPTLTRRLAAIGQEHVFRFAPELSATARQALMAQIAELDLDQLPKLIDTYVRVKPANTLPLSLEPAVYYPHRADNPRRPWNAAAFRSAGEDLLRQGKVAAFVVAGGQGTRLGYDGPKGCFPAGAVTRKPLFRIFAEGILAATCRYGRPIPWYVMTSPLNHDATIRFFESNRHFGLDPGDVKFFAQGVMPSFDASTGRILLADRHEIATNPDGHGGCVHALDRSGSFADMRRRGIEHVSYFQVDNATVKVIDPVFLGMHAAAPDSSGEMSSKMIPKAHAQEKLGVFCVADGKLRIIEYSDLPAELTNAVNADGSLRFNAGSIAIHAISVSFLERLARDPAFDLPLHRADKKVPFVDHTTGNRVEPEAPNGVKLERFVFDALAMCRQSIVYETDRVEEFAPIKNAEGQDSPATCTLLQTERSARWLERCGVRVPRRAGGAPDCTLEISPLVASEAEHLAMSGIASIMREVPRGSMIAL